MSTSLFLLDYQVDFHYNYDMGLFSSRSNSDFKITDFSVERHDEYYQKGFACIDPYVQLQGKPRKRPNKDKIKEGIKYLEAVTKINPENWAAFWLKGKAYQSLEHPQSAYNAFKKAFDIEKENAALNITFVFTNKKKHQLKLIQLLVLQIFLYPLK